MTTPITDAANAISDRSPAIKHFAQLVAAQLEPPAPAPAPAPLFVQRYSAADMQELLTAGDLVRVADDRLTALDATRARFEVRPGDQYLGWSGERAQIQLPTLQGGEGERWRWRFAITLAPDFVFAGGFYNVVWEHHHQGSTGSPPLSLQLKAGRYVLRQTNTSTPGNDWTEYDVGAALPGREQTVEVDCLLSSDPAKASTVVTILGAPPLRVQGKPNLYAGSNVYPEWGLYRAPSQLTQVLTFSEVSRLA